MDTRAQLYAERLLQRGCAADESATIATLARFGAGTLRYAAARRVRVTILTPSERYDEASPALTRMGVDVDAWPLLRPACSWSRNAPSISAPDPR